MLDHLQKCTPPPPEINARIKDNIGIAKRRPRVLGKQTKLKDGFT